MNLDPDGQPATVKDLTADDFKARLRSDGLGLRIGPFHAHIRADVHGLDKSLFKMYRDYPLLNGDQVFNFHVSLSERRRSIFNAKRLVRFTVDGRSPHEDMPAQQALAVLEWGMNMVIVFRSHCFVMLHSAVIARSNQAMLLPAWPGHGKTTLCVAMVHRGWRLLSDEFGLLRPRTGKLIPVPRPMPLKNESIQVIRDFAHDAELGPTIPNTRKGTIAHVIPPTESIQNASRAATVRWIIFPRWIENEPLSIQEIPRAEGHMLLANNSFNYELLGELSFHAVRDVVSSARCFRLVYSNLDDAVPALTNLADETSV